MGHITQGSEGGCHCFCHAASVEQCFHLLEIVCVEAEGELKK